ncbi:hypothetical protein CBM2585_B140015 [Cupriavidus taiwanensis]|nr:hypothetical protein CBM2585_B140015 [Cupriavidus taiwanensis]SPC23889.1 hypothetical protein CT19431_MP90031 [Cupriavidus taiwanensis]
MDAIVVGDQNSFHQTNNEAETARPILCGRRPISATACVPFPTVDTER